MEKELEIEGGILTYHLQEEHAVVVSCHVTGSSVVLPDRIEGFPVTKIEKKAFLSSKKLKEITLPEPLLEIGDWAFAYCSNLASVRLPKRALQFGRGIFKECEKLTSICRLGREDQTEEKIGHLLGAVPIRLETDYLLDPGEAGSGVWLSRFDDKLREFLHTPDEEGYTKMVYCGEEDIVANMDLYLAERRRAKARLCYLRLMNDVGLSSAFRREMTDYLTSHTKGCDAPAAWEVVFHEHGNEQEYYEAFTEAGCLTEENYDSILEEMGEQFPEMKGYLMRYRAKDMEQTDFFDLLSLD